jgi:hypothetical protein
MNKQPRTDNKGWSSSLGIGRGVNPSPKKKNVVTKTSKEPRTWTDSLDKRPERRNTDMDQDVGGWIILGWILERWTGVMWTGLVWLRVGTGGELL